MSVSRRAFGAGLLAASAAGPVLAQAAKGKPRYGDFGLDLAAMDCSVTPGEDFYHYVNGTWLRTAQIPADMSRWHPYDELTEINRQRVKGLLEAAGSATAGTLERKVGDYYAAQLDIAERDRSGFGPVKAQLDRIAHSTLLGLAAVPPIELAEKLIALAPSGLTRVFFSDNGSTAVEIALKIAFQYWQQQPDPAALRRTRFVAFEQAYHGDTLGAVSLGGVESFHARFGPLCFPVLRASNSRIESLERILAER